MALDLTQSGSAEPIGFDEFCAQLTEQGVDLADDDCAGALAKLLARLNANRTFLADIALAELKTDCSSQVSMNAYGAQVLMLGRVAGSHFIRANFWPANDDPVLKASGARHYAYHLPHDHNFDFLTVGYWGPGYRSRWYEYDNAMVAGYCGEKINLAPVEDGHLSPGRILHYRAHRDVHDQYPPATLSISVNIIPENAHAVWRDQYHFDLDRGCLSEVATIGQTEIALRIVAALSEDGLDLAHEFARNHPSDRVRWHAWKALLAAQKDAAARLALLENATSDASSLVGGEARRLQSELTNWVETGVGNI